MLQSDDRERIPGSIGTNIIDVENKVVDEFGNEVPVGEVGELVVHGPNVMKGYYKMPEETVAAIRVAGCTRGIWQVMKMATSTSLTVKKTLLS